MKNKKMTEDELREKLIGAFEAGAAYMLGCHELFEQIHPNCKEYVDKIMKEKGSNANKNR